MGSPDRTGHRAGYCRHMQWIGVVLMFCILMPAFQAMSIAADAPSGSGKVTITSDRLVVNNRTHTAEFIGNVKAVQDEMPAGMERILGILEGAITSKPAAAIP